MPYAVRIMIFVGLFLSFSAGIVTASVGQPDGASDVHVVSHLPATLPQRRTPWCYAFAARSVFSQALCSQSKLCFGADQMAVTNFVGANRLAMILRANQIGFGGGGNGSWWTGGDSVLALRYLSDTQAPIASRECTHEQKFFQVGDLSPFSLSFILEMVVANFNKQRTKTHENASQYFARVVTDPKILPLIDWMAPAMDATNDFDGFSEAALLPPRCQGSSALARTPHFLVKTAKLAEVADIEKQIESVVDKDRMVGLNICAGTLDSSIGECGNHATAVAGYRTYCQAGVCEKQYLFIDSSFFLKTGRNPDGTYWVSARLIAQATSDYIKKVDGKMKDTFKEFKENMSRALSEVVASRAKLLRDYQDQRLAHQARMAQILIDYDANIANGLSGTLSNPNLSVQQVETIKSQIAADRAELVQQLEKGEMPATPDLKQLDETIERLERMVRNSGNLAEVFSDDNLFWIEFETAPSAR